MKRIYSESGDKSAPLWFFIIGFVTIGPFIVAWTFVSSLLREIKASFWYAWNDAKWEVESAIKIIRGAR